MNGIPIRLLAILAVAMASRSLSGQTFARSPSPSSSDVTLEALAKKIDQQNAKIDALSQQILKLQQEVENARPGIMVGEGAPTPPASTSAPAQHPAMSPTDGNTHIVTRGETLTSIAKMYKVTVDELQRYNHIDNPLKLQVGQTVMIPGSPTPGPSAPPGG